MDAIRFDSREIAHDPHAQLCAYNAAFDELGLRFRWDAGTFAALAAIEDEQARISAYIEAHHAHLLTAYSAEFLSQAIIDRKNMRYPSYRPPHANNEANRDAAAA